MIKHKKVYLFLILSTLLLPSLLKAEEIKDRPDNFQAKVVEIIQAQEKTREDGSTFVQQNLKLVGLDDDWQNESIFYYGISDLEVVSAQAYVPGDKVYINRQVDESGDNIFYIVDYVRSSYLYLLFLLFVLAVLIVGRSKGLKALLSLFLSFVVIIKFILPQILHGHDPFFISLIGGLIILGIIIYLTEGFKRKAHLAILSVLISLSATLVLSVIFTKLTKLSGLAQEEVFFLIGAGNTEINFQGLLLAGFIIGAIGVLDDIIVGQIEAVEQIKEANPNLPAKKVFQLAYKIGNAHLGAIVNTLFLTYAGVALPLLLLFVINQNSGITFNRLVNTEVVSTEVVRTLVGSIGVILSMPIATFLAVVKLKHKIKE